MTWTPDKVGRWAAQAGDSPLYVHLCEAIAADPAVLGVLNRIEHQPALNILFAAVQVLLQTDAESDLAGYYPNLTDDPLRADAAGPAFRRFVLEHETEIVEIGATRYTQTNECRRCTALLPGVWAGVHDRFHMVDIGASAGLNLALDRYAYRWDGVGWGDSPLVLEADSLGSDPVPRDITVMRRIGLDLHPVDPADEEDRAWLEALVWPELTDRLTRLRAALDLVREVPIEFVAGDAVDTLPGVLDGLPEGDPVVVMNSYALNQFGETGRAAIEEIISDARRRRPVHRVSLEFGSPGFDLPLLQVDTGKGWRAIGEAHHHGAWLRLYVLP